jgi:parallel beta-helix repeat protein
VGASGVPVSAGADLSGLERRFTHTISAPWRPLVVAILAVAMLAFGGTPAFAGNVLVVPQVFPTIQAAIDAAAPGDTVSVSPGVYHELIDNHAKAITIESTGGASVTTIDGGLAGTVVRLIANPGETPVLRGFTIQNGLGSVFGGGVFTDGGPALIEHNVVSRNFSCNGGGVEASFSSATVRDNVISGNRPNCTGGPGGGGIFVGGAGSATISGNLITGNVSPSDGGGISIVAAGSPTISGNTITSNTTSGGNGGGISLGNQSNARIVNNVIFGNTTGGSGGGIFWLVPFGEPGPTLINNTIAGNTGFGSAVFAGGFDGTTQVVNNILVGSGSQAVLFCGNSNNVIPPIVTFNDVLNTGSGSRYGGICPDQTGVNGNIAADPLFVNAGSDFHLQPGSPAIDAGTNSGAPTVDIEGTPRPLNGVDMGAYEFRRVDTTPPVITVPASITTDATSPGGANVTYSVSASDPDDAVASLNCVPPSGSKFPIGTTMVSCTATDTHGNSAQATFSVHAKGAAEQLSDLLGLVTSQDLGPGESLQDKLTSALAAVTAGDGASACSTLTAFVNEVNAQTGKSLTPTQALQLRSAAKRIEAVLAC